MNNDDMYGRDPFDALGAMRQAQAIAFAPFSFQACRLLRDKGVLAFLESHCKGSTLEEVAEACHLTRYAAQVLLESGLSARAVLLKDSHWSLARTGWYLLNDPMTRVNADFTQDVCYQGLFDLEKALDNGTPAGLKIFGNWPTIYAGLMQLPPQASRSWFAFDHFYSDNSFPEALELVFAAAPKHLLDIGGNTGKWALACLNHDANVQVTIADLAPQLARASENIAAAGFANRFHGHAMDLLDPASPLPEGHDAIWMSQFLDCFSEAQVSSILKRAAQALSSEGSVWIMETCWDRQEFEAAALCLQQISLYFTAMANGSSKMFHSPDLVRLIEGAGLKVAEIHDGLGWGHSLFRCVRDRR